jgi:hypothetical protein
VEGNFMSGRSAFHPQSRFGKGFSALVGRWNVVIKSNQDLPKRHWFAETQDFASEAFFRLKAG